MNLQRTWSDSLTEGRPQSTSCELQSHFLPRTPGFQPTAWHISLCSRLDTAVHCMTCVAYTKCSSAAAPGPIDLGLIILKHLQLSLQLLGADHSPHGTLHTLGVKLHFGCPDIAIVRLQV